MISSEAPRRGAFTGLVSQTVPDKVPNIFRCIEVFKVFFCVFVLFFCQIARGRRPTPALTLTLGLRLERGFAARFGNTDNKCADHLAHRNLFGTLSRMIRGLRTSQRLLSSTEDLLHPTSLVLYE